jgi:hypothetical protein
MGVSPQPAAPSKHAAIYEETRHSSTGSGDKRFISG